MFTAQGAASNKVASRNVRVLVVGNSANTNAYIAMKSAPDLPAETFTATLSSRPQPHPGRHHLRCSGVTENGGYTRVTGLEVDDCSRAAMGKTLAS